MMFRCPQVQFLPLGLAGWRQHHEVKNLLYQPAGGLGSDPSAARLWEVIFTRGRSLDSQPSKASQETPEPCPAIAPEGKLRPSGRSVGIR